MLAGADGSDSPFEMQAIGQGDKDGIDVGVVKDF
jgi:hypothetical protein